MDEFNNVNGMNNDETSGISSSEAMNSVEGASGMTSNEAFNAVEGNAVQGGSVTAEEGAYDADAAGSASSPYADQTNNNNSFEPYTASNPASTADGENGGSKTLSIVSLVCGIVGIVCSFLCCCGGSFLGIPVGIAAVITGFMSKKNNLPGQGMALGGIITGGIAILIGIFGVFSIIVGMISGQ